MYKDIFLLPYAECAVGGLIFHRRIPPSVKMYDVRGGSEIQTRASRFDCQDQKWRSIVLLELFDYFLSFLDRSFAVEDEAIALENP